jgi:hypothetical protein
MFMNNRPSFDRDSWDGHSGHKKSDSVVSDAFSAFDETERSFEVT